ncbi:hypothetical protein CFC21_074960 [Triticum aestivum]|uniref:Protein kinase domain-containing protein n=2 Tax=Triticum aestivum TaxID=4565 RepID=A0A9R1HQA3_WHEAT|nr:putative disease resistance protein RGA1 isoform X1 [Triticum aestivum]XP_044391648.1 putative disease resistance protein RGA1 isoform X1 [Triticum aestivum]XP_044391649.1 putative disease resistance protein RGA1 isoform X1 [Triticum aestivum]XP_044391650.1 putative disease resistance protein RGA1 isoform X1 [Triticum aestivum]KAF7069308.1 hypothetical protein CFC21_074960 [Triticum aestivum]
MASPMTREFTLDFLQHITNNFAEDRIIGKGGFAVVYKGVLDNGEEIALKKLTHIGPEDTKFADEFNNIIRAHHQNIVQYVGYCYHPGRWIEHNEQYIFVHEPTRILCFEYLHRGDLERHLSDKQPCGLDWQTCYNIIKGVCAGLNYLHSVHIYHLDLKPENILLDNNMMPKIGDFGISRIVPSTKTITTTKGTLRGTMGFMPPEYIDKQEISSKYDMFSLGAIIIQIMAGRQNYWNCGRVPSETFIELVRKIWRKKLHPTMSSHTWQEVNTCVRIGLRCLQDDRHKRPTIREIVDELKSIDIKNISPTDEIIDELNQNDRIATEKFSLADEATNLQMRVALAYNHYKYSASIGVHDSSSRLKSPADLMNYEQEPVMRDPEQESPAIGGLADLTQMDGNCCSNNPNLREKVCVHTHRVTMDTNGLTSGTDKCVNLFQWARSAITSDTKEQRFQNNLFDLQRDLQCLCDTLPAMYSLINRAEWRSHNDDVVGQLPKLKDAVYDVEDLLDEITWYNHKVIMERNESQLSFTDFYNSFKEVNVVRERLKTNSKLLEKMGLVEVTLRFDKTTRPETSSFPNETEIFGRDMVLEQIMRLLGVPTRSSKCSKRKREINADEASTSILASGQVNESRLRDLPVLPIVGIGGVGKTTLAQHISSHQKVKSHFDTIIWICVSDDFDEKRLTKEAIESCPGNEARTSNLNSLQHALSNLLDNRKFLIVLDDLWDDALKENGQCWRRFCEPLKNALQGSMMLVTTRSPKVSDLVHTMEPIILEGLKDDVFWKFFKVCVFGSESSNDFPDLELIGRTILPKLKGSPLAAKTLGRMLRDDLRTSHWNNILESELWELDQETTEIVPALRLSYMYLPFHLKRCFSFCAVYPKDKVFEKESLAEIWVAEGFVKHQGVIPVQDIGCQYFNDLLNRSFFQEVQGKYLIHDLLHDMAQKVSEDDCFIVKNNDDFKRIPQNVRHLSVLSSTNIKNSNLLSLRHCRKLRTLLCNKSLANKKTPASLMDTWCSELLHMRVIVCASVNELPDSVGKLKHLRYIEVARACSVTNLPATICRLHNLQVICVNKCRLESLPSDFGMLVNLWRFESQGFKYGPNIRRSRKEESFYGVNLDAASAEQGPGYRFIKNIKQLRGHLEISNVGKLSKYHSAEAQLKNKEYLDKLTLLWGDQSLGDRNDIEVLPDLQPPASLKSLVLEDYRGVSLPTWFQPESLPGLTSVSFVSCHGLETIPTVDINNGSIGFSSLTDLIINGCPCLSSLEQLLDPTYLPVIKRIAIMKCLNLISLPTERLGEFSSLEIFKVVECGKINSQSLVAPSLKKLVLGNKEASSNNDCGNLTDNIQCCSLTYFFLSSSRLRSIQLQMWNLPALQELCISNCRSVTSIGLYGQVSTGGNGSARVLSSLTSLSINDCDELSTIDDLLEKEYLPAIEIISFSCCKKLFIWPKTFGVFSFLKKLKFYDCHRIKWEGLELPSSLQNLWICSCQDMRMSSFIPSCPEGLQSLVSLKLLSCRHMRSIPGHLWSKTLSSVQKLVIYNCSDLESIGGADDISKIPNVRIEDCRKLKGIEQPVKRGNFLIAKKQQQPVKTSSKSVWCP